MRVYRENTAEIAEYRGKKYYRYPDNKSIGLSLYFYHPYKDKTTESLHRAVYTNEVGDIPEGYHIHHKDGNQLNNSVENLVCIERSKHMSKHANESWENRETVQRVCEFCGKTFDTRFLGPIRFCSAKCTTKWRHASGIDDEERVCEYCGETFMTNKYKKHRYCSNSCVAKGRYSRRIIV